MNPNSNIFLVIFGIILINAINSVLCFSPVCIIQWAEDDYSYAFDSKYDPEKNLYVARAPAGKNILELCSRSDIKPGSNEIVKREKEQAVVDPKLCPKPFEWRIFKSMNTRINFVGIAMHTPGKESQIQYYDLGEDYSVLGLIGFVFDRTRNRTEFVWYNLAPGQLLHPEITNTNNKNGVEFEKNWDFFGYDLDDIYSLDLCPLVKVSLAPEQDFLYHNFKIASRKNVLTAPMWPELLDQWQALEIFTRKVAQVLSQLFITAGIHSIIKVKDPTTNTLRTLLLNPRNNDYPSPIPKYFYRSITYRFEFENRKYDYGIMFVMHHNKPNFNAKSNEEKICPEDEAEIAKTGWMEFLAEDQLKSPMYACLYNDQNVKFFKTELEVEFKTFNLNDIPILAVNPETNVEYLRDINVFKEMEAWEEARKKAKEQSSIVEFTDDHAKKTN